MATVTVTTSPATLDSGSSYELLIKNVGLVAVYVKRGPQLSKVRAAGGQLRVQPEGSAVTAYVADATNGSLDVTVTQASDPEGGASTGQPAPLAAQGYDLGYRSVVTNQPVPTFRPTSTNKQIALDIVPNGSPTDDGTSAGAGYGVAWIDLCSTDVRDNTNPTSCAHMAASSQWAEFGSTAYGLTSGQSAPPIFLTIADDNTGTFTKSIVGKLTKTTITLTPTNAGAGTVQVRNTDAGTGSFGELKITADNSAVNNAIRTYSSTFTFETGNPWRNALHVWGSAGNGIILDATFGPIRFLASTSGTSSVANERMRIDANGNIMLGTQSALATNATNGFVYIRGGAGAPTGTPATSATGLVPMYYDSTNNKLYAYNGGWKGVTLA